MLVYGGEGTGKCLAPGLNAGVWGGGGRGGMGGTGRGLTPGHRSPPTACRVLTGNRLSDDDCKQNTSLNVLLVRTRHPAYPTPPQTPSQATLPSPSPSTYVLCIGSTMNASIGFTFSWSFFASVERTTDVVFTHNRWQPQTDVVFTQYNRCQVFTHNRWQPQTDVVFTQNNRCNVFTHNRWQPQTDVVFTQNNRCNVFTHNRWQPQTDVVFTQNNRCNVFTHNRWQPQTDVVFTQNNRCNVFTHNRWQPQTDVVFTQNNRCNVFTHNRWQPQTDVVFKQNNRCNVFTHNRWQPQTDVVFTHNRWPQSQEQTVIKTLFTIQSIYTIWNSYARPRY